MTPEEIARINRTVPGFANMSPEQQQGIISRLRGGQPVQTAAQPSVKDQAVAMGTPIAAQAGLQTVLGQGAAAAPAVPAVGAETAISTNPGLMGVLAGGYTGYNQATGAKKITEGRNTSSIEKAALYPVTGGLDTIAEKTGLTKLLGGGKSNDQQGRDQDRASLQKGGVLDENYNLTLSDGSKVNLGLDGSVKNYNVDFSEKGIGDTVALVNPFAYIVAGGDAKRASDLAGQFTNAIKGSKDQKAEAKALFEKAGLTKEDALSRIDALKVDDQTKAVFKGTVNSLGLKSVQNATTTTAPTGGGFRIVINAPKQPKQEDPRIGMRRAIAQNMLQESSQPIAYPSQNPNYKSQNFSGTLQKLVGM